MSKAVLVFPTQWHGGSGSEPGPCRAYVANVKGPTKIIELDGRPRAAWRLEEGALHLWEGKLWSVEPVGCVLCVENEDEVTFSRTDEEGVEHFCCTQHGEVISEEYLMTKKYVVSIAGVTREGEEASKDSMLFPSSMSQEERRELIEKLLDEAEKDEEEEGAGPPEED